MAAEAEYRLQHARYQGEQRRWNFEQYVKSHVDQHHLVAPSEFRRPSKRAGIWSEYFRILEFRKYTDSDPFRWPSELSESESEEKQSLP